MALRSRFPKAAAKAAATLVAALSVVTMSQSVAAAHIDKNNITDGLFKIYGFVEVNANGGSSHTQIAVCDTQADNIGVWVEFYYRAPGHRDDIYNTISDSNGSASGCGRFTVPTGGYIVGFRGRYGSNGYDETGWDWSV